MSIQNPIATCNQCHRNWSMGTTWDSGKGRKNFTCGAVLLAARWHQRITGHTVKIGIDDDEGEVEIRPGDDGDTDRVKYYFK